MDRRTLLSGAACAAVLGLSQNLARPARASGPRTLTITRRSIEINGKAADVFALTGPDGKPGLSFNAGDLFDVTLKNRLDAETMIHWHGLLPPPESDGVPGLPAPLLQPGERRSYRFPVGEGGTHWMHAHTLQEQALLAAPLIVRTAEERAADEQEVVVLLHDFSFTPAEELLARLKGSAGAHGSMDHGSMDHGSTKHGMGGMGGMTMAASMAGMDLNDIEYDAYLANDRTLDDPEVIRTEAGGRIRLRIINGATATGFTIDLGKLTGELIAVDGQPVVPVSGSLFPLTMGQRADIRLQLPSEGGSFPILARREGAPERTGVVLAAPGAEIARIPVLGDVPGPVLDLGLEARLRAARPLATRPADRSFMVHLTGNMSGYSWGMAGEPIKLAQGQRIEVEMMNMSMMAHPMHLHGHRFQVTAIGGKTFAGAVRDTVLVPPMQMVRFAFDADNPGKDWAFHCHHLYHMASGMITTISYEEA